MLFGFESGESRMLREAATSGRIAGGIISPDGELAAFLLQSPQKPVEVRVIDTTGKGERLVATLSPEIRGVALNSWSDADQRIATEYGGRTSRRP